MRSDGNDQCGAGDGDAVGYWDGEAALGVERRLAQQEPGHAQ